MCDNATKSRASSNDKQSAFLSSVAMSPRRRRLRRAVISGALDKGRANWVISGMGIEKEI